MHNIKIIRNMFFLNESSPLLCSKIPGPSRSIFSLRFGGERNNLPWLWDMATN